MTYRLNIRPRLVDPLPITVQQVDRASAVVDSVAREPIGPVPTGASVTLDAQVSWGPTLRSGRAAGGNGGRSQQNQGYLVFRTYDLTRASVTLKEGDRVLQIGARVLNVPVYLYAADDAGFHWNQRRLEVWRFEDRAPTHGGTTLG